MAIVNTRENRQVIDYLARDYDSFRQALVGLIPAKLPEWTDNSETDFGIVLIELFAYMADILSYYQDRAANEAFLATAQERRSVIQHLQLIGYEMAGAAPAAARLSLLVTAAPAAAVEVRPGDQFATVSGKQQSSVTFEYAGSKPAVINPAAFLPSPFEPGMLEAVNVIAVQEGKTITREAIGVSDGTPNQRFPLAQPAVLRNTVQIIADTSPPTPPWRLRKNLIFSGRAFTEQQLAALEYQERIASTLAFSRTADPDFALETDENEITTVVFGDGQYGMIPPVGATMLATYRTGGGALGNVGAGQITVIADAPQLQSIGARVVNRAPASGGADRESIDQAQQYAPTVFSSMNRAVTADDYVAQALLFPGVSKARAVPGNWNTIQLFIAPEGSGEDPSDILRRDLLAYFEDKRMLTTQITIAGPDYVPLEIDVTLGIKAYFRNVDVIADAQAALAALFDFSLADFAQTLYLSKVFEALEAMDGVDFVVVNRYRRRGDADLVSPTGKIVLTDNQIAVLESADLVVNGDGGVSEESA
jgi:hypothetical protein